MQDKKQFILISNITNIILKPDINIIIEGCAWIQSMRYAKIIVVRAVQQGNLPTGISKNNGCKLSDVPHNGSISGSREP